MGLKEPARYGEIKNVISKSRPLVFDFDYPIYDQNYKAILEEKILLTFYQRELCDIPFSRWKLYLWQKMNRIMPYYNQLYESAALSFNPLFNVDYSRNYDRNNNRNSKTTGAEDSTVSSKDSGTENSTFTSTDNSNTTGKSVNKNSDTPQGTIIDLETGTYMSSAQINDVNNGSVASSTSDNDTTRNNTHDSTTNRNTSDSTTDTNLEKYIENVSGKQGTESYSSLLKEFRETFLNIDDMILNELESLFFMIY